MTKEQSLANVTRSPAQKADAAKIEALLVDIYYEDPGNVKPDAMANHLIDNGIGDIAILTRQLQECERFRAVDKKILDDYIDREYNPENPDFEERI